MVCAGYLGLLYLPKDGGGNRGSGKRNCPRGPRELAGFPEGGTIVSHMQGHAVGAQ